MLYLISVRALLTICLVVGSWCFIISAHQLDLPDLDLLSPGNLHRSALARRALRVRRMAQVMSLLVCFVQLLFWLFLISACPDGADNFRSGFFGPTGPWLICLLTTIPIGAYLASENDAREVRESTVTPVDVPGAYFGWQYQRALAEASRSRTPDCLS